MSLKLGMYLAADVVKVKSAPLNNKVLMIDHRPDVLLKKKKKAGKGVIILHRYHLQGGPSVSCLAGHRELITWRTKKKKKRQLGQGLGQLWLAVAFAWYCCGKMTFFISCLGSKLYTEASVSSSTSKRSVEIQQGPCKMCINLVLTSPRQLSSHKVVVSGHCVTSGYGVSALVFLDLNAHLRVMWSSEHLAAFPCLTSEVGEYPFLQLVTRAMEGLTPPIFALE